MHIFRRNKIIPNANFGESRIEASIESVEEDKFNDLSLKDQENDIEEPQIIYQVVKLKKYTEPCKIKNVTYKRLQSVSGLSYIAPDTRFYENSVLSDLISSSGSEEPCEFLIVITMYNEESKELNDTLDGVISNLKIFVKNGVKPHQIACIIIADGVEAFFEAYDKDKDCFLKYCDKDRIFDRFPDAEGDILKCKIPNENEDDEFAHLFMQKKKVFDENNHTLELQLIFCIKQKNKRKLNTHLWFFGGFCHLIQPKYVMLLDVGTKPLDSSLYYLYEAMEDDERVAGCCGEIAPMTVNGWNLVTSAQLVEYKFAHTFDKSLESLFGYVSVLPGAFSAYRWKALEGPPLWEHYFKSFCHPELMTAFQANIYLAEDRVLCLSLVSKMTDNEPSYILKYIRKSIAITDVPSNIEKLMVQRRRWINGSWFALIDSIKRFSSVYKTKHSRWRKFFFTLQLIYFMMNVVFSWFMVGSFYLAFSVIVHETFPQKELGLLTLGNIIILIYTCILIIIFIVSLGVEPNKAKETITAIACILGVYMIGTIYMMILFLINLNLSSPTAAALAFSTLGMFGINIFLNNAVVPIFKGIFHFLFLTPTYINIFSIYAICNLHDCTWGNRPDKLSDEEKNRLSDYKAFRTRWLIFWVLTNTGYSYFINLLDKSKEYGINYIVAIAVIGIAILGFRFFCGCLYLVDECLSKKRKNNSYKIHDENWRAEHNNGNQNEESTSNIQIWNGSVRV